MQVQSPEIIREEASLTPYRIAKMLGISQKNYKDIISGHIKVPNGKMIIGLIIIGVKYAKMPLERIIELISADFGISEADLVDRYNENKKVNYKSKRKSKK